MGKEKQGRVRERPSAVTVTMNREKMGRKLKVRITRRRKNIRIRRLQSN